MKRQIIKPGFEFIFSLCILAVLGLPPLVSAQNTKDEQITITNGDTTINGRNIKDLSPKERQVAMKDIGSIVTINNSGKKSRMDYHYSYNTRKDSGFNARPRGDRNGDRDMDKGRRGREDSPMMEFSHKNTQLFNYVSVDNNGVSTNVSYRVSEPTEPVANLGGTAEKTQMEKLDVMDLNIVPEFAAGKTMLMFTLPSTAPAVVLLKDSKGTTLWSDKVIKGSFNKSFPLGLNGIYYLRIKQGSRLEVKKIFKEQR